MAKKKTSVPKSFGYFDKYRKQEVSFKPKSDELVFTVEPEAPGNNEKGNEQKLRAALAKGEFDGLSKANFARGVGVLNVAPNEGGFDLVQQRGAEALEDVMNSIPAFVDSDGSTRYFIPDEITVQFRRDISREDAEKAIEALGSEIVVRQRTKGYYTISVPEGSDAFTTIAAFNELDSVRFAETSEISFNDAQEDPVNDERFNELWGLHNEGQTVDGVQGTTGVDIKAVEAWKTTRGNENVVIVVIDSGMDLDHEDLAANALERRGEDWDFVADDGSPDDSDSHGTHVCGTAAGLSDNGRGISGVAPNCKLMPLRINLQAGMNANRADAINFVGDKVQANPAKRYVINCSWICSGSFSGILAAIDDAVDRGAVVVFAAGNSGRDMDSQSPQFPGVHPNAINVAAIDSNDNRASFSNFGSQVDVSAPGKAILSTVLGDQYQFKNGTSMAAPHVAGTLALIWSANMSLSNTEVREILESNCDPITGAGSEFDGKLGKGRINAARAVAAATAGIDDRALA